MIFEMILLAIIGAIWLFAGYQIIKFLVPEIGLLTAVSLGAMLGEILYLFFVNVSSYAMPVFFSSRTILIGLLIVGVFFWILNRKNKTTLLLEIDKPHLFFLIIIISIIFIFYAINLFFSTEINFDFPFHQPLAATIAEGNFPPRLPFNPNYSVQYHYGIDLLAGSLISVVGVKPWNAFNVLVLWNLFWTFGIAFIFGWILGNKNYLSGLFAALFLFFGGNLKYVFELIRIIKYNDIGTQINEDIFKSDMIQGYAIQIFHNPSTISVPAILLLLCLIYFLTQNKKKYLSIITGIVVGTIAILSEENFSILVAVLFFIIIVHIAKSFYNYNKINITMLRSLIVIIFIGILAAILQGGVISDMLFQKNKITMDQGIHRFKIRTEPGFIYWKTYESDESKNYGIMPLTNPTWPLFLLNQMGSLPFVFPLLIISLYGFYKRNRLMHHFHIFSIMIGMTFLGLTIPIFVEYVAHDIEIARFFIIFRNIGNILLGASIGLLTIFIKKSKYYNALLFFLIIFISLNFIGPIAFNLTLLSNQLQKGSWGWRTMPHYIKNRDIQIANDVKKILPAGSSVLTNNVITVSTLWGRFIPSAKSRQKINEFNPLFIELFPNPSIDELRNINIRYVYIAEFQEQKLYGSPPKKLKQGVDKKYINYHHEWFNLMRKWKFDDQEYSLYKVL